MIPSRALTTFLSAATVSAAGDVFSLIAVSVLVLDLTDGSASALGVTAALGIATRLLVSFPAGALLDRMSLKALMVAADAFRALLLTLMALASAGDQLALWHVWIAVSVLGLVEGMYRPGRMMALPQLAPAGQLLQANGWLGAGVNGAALVTPALAGLLVGAVGASSALALDGLSFAFAAAAVSTLPITSDHVEQRDQGAGGEGLRFILHSNFLRIVLPMMAVSNFAGAIIDGPLALVFVRSAFGSGVVSYGVLSSMFMAGLVGGNLLAARASTHISLGVLLSRGPVVSTAMIFSIAATPWLGTAVASYLLLGLTYGLMEAPYNAYLQATVPDHLRGRVFSMRAMFGLAGTPFALGFGGLMMDTLGARATFVLAGFAESSVAVTFLTARAVRNAAMPA